MQIAHIWGGTGGLGSEIDLNPEYGAIKYSSKDMDVLDMNSIAQASVKYGIPSIVLYFAGKNYDSTIHKLNDESIRNQMEANIYGFLNVVRYTLPYMRAANFGRIIYASSVLANDPLPGTGIYAATKCFSDSIVKTIAKESAKYNVTANSLRLGYFDAGLTYTIPEEIRNKIKEKIPAKRFGTAEELNTVLKAVLATPYINGATIDVNGGL